MEDLLEGFLGLIVIMFCVVVALCLFLGGLGVVIGWGHFVFSFLP